jgi:hypothetical protein
MKFKSTSLSFDLFEAPTEKLSSSVITALHANNDNLQVKE